MSNEKVFLGKGRYGLVHGTSKCVIKKIDDKDAFNAEVGAYGFLNNASDLCGRVPKCYGINPDKRLLYLERIFEPTLRQALPDESTLLRIKDHVSKTIDRMHRGGWCHGDINLNNIFASGLLFDFSHAHTKSKLSEQAWEDFQKQDRRQLESCFLQATGLKKLEAAIALLDSGIDDISHQAELAELLRRSKTSPELIKKLEKIVDPIPSLALEICRAFRCEGRHDTGMCLLQKIDLPVPCDDESRRLYVKIQGEIALCESLVDDKKACQLFADAVRSSKDLLGGANKDTIQLRVTYAMFLESSSRYAGALDVLDALKVDSKDRSHPWRELVLQMEKRLRAKRARKRNRERPMPAEQTLVEDDKENMHQSGLHTPSKKRKVLQETGT